MVQFSLAPLYIAVSYTRDHKFIGISGLRYRHFNKPCLNGYRRGDCNECVMDREFYAGSTFCCFLYVGKGTNQSSTGCYVF